MNVFNNFPSTRYQRHTKLGLREIIFSRDEDITRLQRKVAQLEGENTELFEKFKEMSVRHGEKSLAHARLFDECERLRVDAARYRWLRYGGNGELVIVAHSRDTYPDLLRAECLDAAIDAQLTKDQSNDAT